VSSRFNFFFTEALRSLSTNVATSVAATLSMLVALLVVGVCAIVLTFVYGQAREVSKDAGRVQVFLKETVTETQVNALRSQLEGMNEVESVTYVSKDDALDRARELFKDNPEMLKNLPSNPFPASVEARLDNPRLAEAVSRRMDNQAGVDSVEFGGPEAKKIVRGATWVSGFMLVLGIFLVGAATMLVANTIRLSIFARRREIEVMKLVGASNSFVRLPFMIEGFLCGLAAALGAIAVIALTSRLVGDLVSRLDVGGSSTVAPLALVFLGLLGMGILLGGFGSGLTIRKYLRV
jgi:cell division transport system permease protein